MIGVSEINQIQIGQNNLIQRDNPLGVSNLPPDQLSDEFFDNKGTSRKDYENEYYKRICSEIIENFMYLGSDFIAQDEESFDKFGITHVINCAADYSANYFQHTKNI